MTKLYFAYGSNTDIKHLKESYAKHDCTAADFSVVSPGWLPDMELVFHYRSSSWDAGAADVRRRIGAATPGVIYEVSDAGWAMLDRKEGVRGGYYERKTFTALTVFGAEIEVVTYQVCPDRREGYVEPSSEYVELIRKGLMDYCLPIDQLERAARGDHRLAMPGTLFTYGTLMRGESRHGVLTDSALKGVLHAEAPGLLFDLGTYPAMRFDGNAVAFVSGELARVIEHEALIQRLDDIEGFTGYGNPGSLYRRIVIPVAVGEGLIATAWTYVYARELAGAPRILSGMWRAPRGSRQNNIM